MIKLKKKHFVYLVYIVVAFCIGILYGHYKFYPIPKIINLKNNIFIKEKEIKENKKIKIVKRINLKPNCKLEKIYDLKINSILFIGHGYPTYPWIVNFIIKNNSKIKHIFFLGDMLVNPSKKRINKFQKTLNTYNISYDLIPGNHEVGFGDNASRDAFENHFKFKNFEKKKIEGYDLDFYLQDSSKDYWQINDDHINLINNNRGGSKNILLRHHIPVEEFYYIANSGAGLKKKILKIDDLERKFIKPITFIAGDIGNKTKGNICYKGKNIKILLTGTGTGGSKYYQEILVLNNNKFKSIDINLGFRENYIHKKNK